MKILKLKFENLNSLKSEHEINFEDGLLAEAGIFSITGPTGAGKSTILDAMTLALFGRAARYDGKPNPENVMTRGTGECSAEVVFECAKGRHVATWSLARARKKADGKMQSAKRQIAKAEADGGEILAEKIKDVDEVVEELSGLDYERFLRSVLLAQGKFKEFLDASDKDRGELLEKITGTEIYSQISRKTYEIVREKEGEVEDLKRALQGVQVMDEQELLELNQEQGGKNETLQVLEKSRSELVKKLDASLDHIKAGKNLMDLQQQLQQWAVDDENFADQLAALGHHQQTLPLQPVVGKWEGQVTELKKVVRELGDLSKRQGVKRGETAGVLLATGDHVGALIKTGLADVEKNEGDLNQQKEELDSIAGWLEQHGADQVLGELLESLRPLGESLRTKAGKLTHDQKRLQDLLAEGERAEGERQKATEEKSKLAEALKTAAQAKSEAVQAFGDLAGQRTMGQWRQWAGDQGEAVQRAKEVKSLRESWQMKVVELGRSQEACPALEKKAQQAELDYESGKVDLKGAEEILADKQKLLDQAIKIASLEQHRAELKDGEACPLCGSQQHPFAEQDLGGENKDRLARDEKQKKVAELREQLDQLASQAVVMAKDLKHAKQKVEQLQGEVKHHLALFEMEAGKVGYQGTADDESGFEQWCLLQQKGKENAQRKLEQLELLEIASSEASRAFDRVENQMQVWEVKWKALELAKNKRLADQESLQTEIKGLEDTLTQLIGEFNGVLGDAGDGIVSVAETSVCCAALQQRQAEYERRSRQLEQGQNKLKHLKREQASLGEQLERLKREQQHWQSALQDLGDLDVVRERAAVEVDSDETVRRRAGEQVVQELAELSVLLEQKSKEELRRQQQVASSEEDLQQALGDSPFDAIEDWRAARLSEQRLIEIQQQKQELAHRNSTLQGQMQQVKKTLAELESVQRVEEGAVPALQDEITVLSERISEMQQRLGKINLLLEQDEQARKDQAGQLAKIEDLEKEQRPWRELNDLIGKADGSKFSKYAQGLTLAQLLLLANVHLREINDRYQIERMASDGGGGEESLGLQIVDLYQGDAIRPIRSLSGGESFLISLALALGLSDLAGSDTRIESLFIDEGFGTLDTDTLDVALAALENLRLSNRTIGIISHVDALKQRIGAQIQVSKSSNGYGTLAIVG